MKYQICDITKDNIPFPRENFDIVLILEVLEHISPIDASTALKEIKRVIKPNGVLIISTPNFARLGNRLAVLFGHSLRGVESYGFQVGRLLIYGHIYEYTVDELVKLLEHSGFKIDRIFLKNFYDTRFSLSLLTKFFERMRDSILVKASRA